MRDIDKLIKEMSLKEKLAEITQLYGSEYSEDDSTFMGIDYRFLAKPELAREIGSILGVAGAKRLKKAQKEHIKQSKKKYRSFLCMILSMDLKQFSPPL